MRVRLITSIRKPAARAIATLQAFRAFRPIAGSSPDAGAIRIGQHDRMPGPEIKPRLLDGTLTPGVAHGQDEGLLLDRPVNVPVPSTSMRVPPTEPGSPGSFLVMIAMVGLRKQLLQFWDMAL